MPGLISHYLFGEQLIKQLPESSIKNMIIRNRAAFNLGLQGPDIFFYYLPTFYKKDIYFLGTRMHKKNIGSFFNKYLNFTQDLNDTDKSIALAYLCGFLGHYSLDYHAHPYIYSKAGFLIEGKKETYRHGADHRRFETNIDILMLGRLEHKKPSDIKLWSLVKVNKEQSRVISTLTSKAIREVYHMPINPKDVSLAILSIEYTNRLLQGSNDRRKKFIISIEHKFVSYDIISSFMYSDTVMDNYDYLNLNKTFWASPFDSTRIYNCSFLDIFNASLDTVKEIIRCLNLYLEQVVQKDMLMNLIGNRSLHTGLDFSLSIQGLY